MIKTIKHWFIMVAAPAELETFIKALMELRGYKTGRVNSEGRIIVSNFFLMHAKAAQVGVKKFSVKINSSLLKAIYEITAWDSRTVLTWAALLMVAYILDVELPQEHFWNDQGGSEAFFR